MRHARFLAPAALALVAGTPLVFVWACKAKSSDSISAAPDPSTNVTSLDASMASSSPPVASTAPAVPIVASAVVDASAVLDCDRWFKGMQVGAEAVLRKYSACTTDADCVTVSARVCIGLCDTAINKAGATEHARAMKAAQPQCDKFMNSSCIYTYPIAVPTCPMMIPTCDHGSCKAKWH